MDYIYSVYDAHKDILWLGNYHIIFVRRRDDKKMIDIWRCSYNPYTQSGPLMDCFTFADGVRAFDLWIASWDSVLVLGREEELRRNCKTIDEYVDRNVHIPNFPDWFGPEETFF